MMKKHFRTGMLGIGCVCSALLFSGCDSIGDFLRDLDEESYTEDPNNENYKGRYVIGICTIIKYPRAGDLEKEIEGLDGSRVWINSNQNFSSKYIKDAVSVPRPGNPNLCDLRVKMDRLGKLQWQILAGMHIGKPVALVIDGVYYGSFYPEPPRSERDDWVFMRVGINPFTANGVVKFAKKNYVHFNPNTKSWFD